MRRDQLDRFPMMFGVILLVIGLIFRERFSVGCGVGIIVGFLWGESNP